MYVYKSLLQTVCQCYVSVPRCGSLAIQKYAPTTPVQLWGREAFSDYREMKAVHACKLQNVAGSYLPFPGSGSLVISKYKCTALVQSSVRETIRRIEKWQPQMYVYKSLLQIVCWCYVLFPGCGSSVIQKYVCTTPVQPWVREALIAFRSYREMKAVHAYPLQNMCESYLPAVTPAVQLLQIQEVHTGLHSNARDFCRFYLYFHTCPI